MSVKLRRVAAVAAAFALAAVGLTGCSDDSGDKAACEKLEATLALDAPDRDVDEETFAGELLEGGLEAAKMAKSPALAEDIELFTTSFAETVKGAEVDEASYFDTTIATKKIVQACTAVGADIPRLEQMIDIMGVSDLTVEELEELRDYESTLVDEDEEEVVVEEDGADGDDDGFDFDFDAQNLDYDFEQMDEEIEKTPALYPSWEACFDGDMEACDTLYQKAPDGSELKTFGADCGGFDVGNDGAGCAK